MPEDDGCRSLHLQWHSEGCRADHYDAGQLMCCQASVSSWLAMQTELLDRRQVAVATNPTHYGNPSTGCESDEQAVRVQGLAGDFCSPKCSSSGSCPSDVPSGETASPECALRTTTGDKYCALICQSDSECGGLAAGKHARMACVACLCRMRSSPVDACCGLRGMSSFVGIV